MNAFGLPAFPRRLDMRRIAPVDPPRARASGPAPYRILAIGGALLAGAGVLTHDLALTGTIARGVARRCGHGVDVDSAIVERGGPSAAVQAVHDRDLSRVDAIVLLLDEGDPVADATRAGRLAKTLRARLTPAASITLVIPPTSGQHGVQDLGAFADIVQMESGGSNRIVQLADRATALDAAVSYAVWGEAIAATVAGGLRDPIAWSDATEPLDERRRLNSLEGLQLLDEDLRGEFHHIIASARTAYGVTCASLALIDGTHTRFVVRQGFDTVRVPRERSICDVALRTYGGVITGDASTHDRFRHSPLVASGDARFYAGYRFESADGQPIGTLCVFDRAPRPALAQDLTLLRDFATSAERRLWKLTQRSRRR